LMLHHTMGEPMSFDPPYLFHHVLCSWASRK
jgi:hypothetical protein